MGEVVVPEAPLTAALVRGLPLMRPETRYARSKDGDVAYHVVGDGPVPCYKGRTLHPSFVP